MRLAFYGGQTAGIITLLTLLARKQEVAIVIPQDKAVEDLATLFSLEITANTRLNTPHIIKKLKQQVDFLICCHGKTILQKELVQQIRCINLHPCLYKYKGAKPIKRLLEDKNPRASVAAHWMVEKVDAGQVIVEEFIDIQNIESKTESQVYSELYPLYSKIVLMAPEKINISSI